jgi:hypothetical protein
MKNIIIYYYQIKLNIKQLLNYLNNKHVYFNMHMWTLVLLAQMGWFLKF